MSYLYRDNPFYRFAEAVIVGVSAAYYMVVALWTTLVPNLVGKLWPAIIQSTAMPGLSSEHEDYWWLYFVPLVLGIMLLWRLMPKGRLDCPLAAGVHCRNDSRSAADRLPRGRFPQPDPGDACCRSS